MRKPFLGIVGAAALIAATAGSGLAAVNCAMVKKDMDMGRKVEDIAEKMAVPVDDVKKCQALPGTAGGNSPGTPANTPASAPAPGKAPAPASQGH